MTSPLRDMIVGGIGKRPRNAGEDLPIGHQIGRWTIIGKSYRFNGNTFYPARHVCGFESHRSLGNMLRAAESGRDRCKGCPKEKKAANADE